MSPVSDSGAPKLDTCGCCGAGQQDAGIRNRAGLPALAYRLGTHSVFLRRMLEMLPALALPDGPHAGARPLQALSTRSSEDAAIALLDAWAIVADVLTFYQERIANEGFLRTATERFSVLQLARAIGYELKPGVAASTFLAFAVTDAAGSPQKVTIPVGVRVQNVPEQGKLPQTFETVEQIEARVEWNTLRPQMLKAQELKPDTGRVYLKGTNLNLKAGDLLLLVVKDGGVNASPRRIRQVSIETALQRTQVDLEGGTPPPLTQPPFVITKLAAPTLASISFNAATVQQKIVSQQWRERDLGAMIAIQRWQPFEIVVAKTPPPPPPPLSTADAGVFAFRVRAGIFGHNAPNYFNLPQSTNLRGDANPNPWDPKPDGTGSDRWEIWKDPNRSPVSYYAEAADADAYLERNEPGILRGSWIVLENSANLMKVYRVGAAHEASLSGFAMSGKATGLRLMKEDGASPLANNGTDKPAALKVRNTTAHAQSEALTLAMLPIEQPVAKGSTSLTLDTMVLGLQIGQSVSITGELANDSGDPSKDTPGVMRQEMLGLTDVVHSGGLTTIFFKNKLQYSYIRKTVALSANVARATHGETVAREVLGGGDGSAANQRFGLKKPPLTYVSARTAGGAASTLAVRVNDVLWQEAPALFDLDARAQKYVLRTDDDGKTTVIFGDGKNGARLPTGVENVVASYRSGLGPDGDLPAGSLTLLQNPPLGIRAATNPVPASGAAAPERLEQSRVNAPRTVLTLDRIVSLADYENFARGFAGIGKARAVALRQGETRVVHITVAAANGGPADPSSDLFKSLRDAVAAAHDFTEAVDIRSYAPQFFYVKARIVRDPRYLWTKVQADVEAALKSAFSFEQRGFAQGVSAAEVTAAIQGVPGVVASDLDQLYLADDPAGPAQTSPALFLAAADAAWPQGQDIQAAQLALINPVGITLTEMIP